jgi:hypothetical protein
MAERLENKGRRALWPVLLAPAPRPLCGPPSGPLWRAVAGWSYAPRVTNLALPKGDDYPGAAAKHLNDAAALVAARRFDGAGYLAGYVVECSLRTVIMVGELARRGSVPRSQLRVALAPGSTILGRLRKPAADEARSIGRDHDLDALAKATTGYAGELNAGNARYASPIDVKKPPFGGSWTHTLRYKAEGAVQESSSKDWFEEAKKVYEATVGQMLRDGVIRK